MKYLKSARDVEMALELFQLSERIHKDEKRAKELREHFKGKLSDGTAICAGLTFNLESVDRECFDTKKLKIDFGKKLEPYISISTYRTLRVRKAA